MTTPQIQDVLVVGATGSIGLRAVAASPAAGHRARSLARRADRASDLPDGVELAIGDQAQGGVLAAVLRR